LLAKKKEKGKGDHSNLGPHHTGVYLDVASLEGDTSDLEEEK